MKTNVESFYNFFGRIVTKYFSDISFQRVYYRQKIIHCYYFSHVTLGVLPYFAKIILNNYEPMV